MVTQEMISEACTKGFHMMNIKLSFDVIKNKRGVGEHRFAYSCSIGRITPQNSFQWEVLSGDTLEQLEKKIMTFLKIGKVETEKKKEVSLSSFL